MKILVRVLVALVALTVLGVLLVRSIRSTGAQPFTIERQYLDGWTLALAPDDDQLGSVLSLTPPMELMPPLTRALFARMGESLHYPPPAIPLVLRSEFQRALAGTLTPAALLDLARDAGLDTATIQPRCMAERRLSEPGGTRGVYFLRFDLPEFARFRALVAERLQAAGGEAALFDPAALSPVLLAAGLDARTSGWLPLGTNGDTDCFAPIIVEEGGVR